uniref:Odorant-binding protein 17 n=1 Tax=Pyrrhalta maculicollis TaxID=226885 RepID=A0A1J0KKG4_9CUCU|nr:odorant-binding protein 17 [Pyrrhalta maculicollis]
MATHTSNMKWLVVGLCLYLIITRDGWCAMSEKQMNATKKLIRNSCTAKSKVAPEIIDAMHKGDFSDGQCYLHCIMNTYKLIKPDGSFDWEGGITTVNANAPPNIAVTATASIKNCKDALKNRSDKCAGAAEVAKCIYEDDPPNYFLP